MTRRQRCSCCMDIRSNRKDFRRGGVEIDDFDEDFRYINLKKKPKGMCPKEKEAIPCQEFRRVVRWFYYSRPDNLYRENGHWECVKCYRIKDYWWGS